MSNEKIVRQIQQGIDVSANREKLCIQNRPFIRQQVRKLCGISGNDISFDDYEQEGFIGLLSAAMKYDASKGTKFLSFAGWYIRAAIIRYSENCSSCVRMPVYLKGRIRKYVAYREQYKDEKGRYPSRDEMLALMGISEKSLAHLEKTIYNMRIASTSQYCMEDGGDMLSCVLKSDGDIEGMALQSIYNMELKKALDAALLILDTDTRMVIQSIYYQQNSVSQTARIFGCSRQCIYDKTHKGFWKILHSPHRKVLECFMWDGYKYNEYLYSEFADIEENEFLL